ncbi:MAG: sigma-70 family RNA polymerase sigma factor [Myxococcota bacterium]
MTEDTSTSGRGRRPIHELTDDEAMVEYEDYVRGIAANVHKRLHMRMDIEELVNAGRAGLFHAKQRYDATTSKAAFTSYAYYRIKGAMLDECRKTGWLKRDRDLQMANDLAATNDYFETIHEDHAADPPTRSLEESIDRVSGLVGDALTILFVRNDELEGRLREDQPRQDKVVEEQDRNAKLREAIDQLDELERAVIQRHHFEDESMTSIAEDFRRSVPWCSRVHTRAIGKLRDLLTDPHGAPLVT